MAQNFWVKNIYNSAFSKVNNFFVKTTTSGWAQITDAWVKTSTSGWSKFYAAKYAPDTNVELTTSYGADGYTLKLQGINKHWTPTPTTLKYFFKWADKDGVISFLGSGGVTGTTITNPSSGSTATYPSSTSYITISTTGSDYSIGGTSSYYFEVRAYDSGGTAYPSISQEVVQIVSPTKPTVTVAPKTNSLELAIKSSSQSNFDNTNRYIVYTSDATNGTVTSGGGRGGYAVESSYGSEITVTLTGLSPDIDYTVYVVPFTGNSGSTTSNATGYKGETFSTTAKPLSPYKFAFGNKLYVSTNGYIGLDVGAYVDNILNTGTGRFLGILPGDLYQSTTTSIWYWSDDTEFRVRWEGYHYGDSAKTRVYEVTFVKDQSYAIVYAETVTSTTEGTSAFVKDNVAMSSYPSALTSGKSYLVYFDSTSSPVLQTSYTAKQKAIMKQVTGITGGGTDTRDQGYTEIVTATNQAVAPTLLGGVARTINTGTTFTDTNMNMYVSTNGYIVYSNNSPGSIAIPSFGKVLNIFGPNDLKQVNSASSVVNVKYKNTTNYFVVHWSGVYISALSQNVEYEARFYWNSDKVEVYAVANNLSVSHYQSDNAFYVDGVATKTWALNSTALASFTPESGMLDAGAPNGGSDDGYTVINAIKPVAENMVVAPTTYSAPGTQAKNFTSLNGTIDDGWFAISLPFAITVNGNSYSTIYVGTNSYVTFESGSNAFSSLGATNPTNPKIMIDAGDRGSSSIYYASDSTSWTIRYEGSASTSGSPIAIIWQLSGTSSNKKRMRLDIQTVAGGGTTGAYDKGSTLKSSLGGAGTSWFIDSSSATSTTGATSTTIGPNTTGLYTKNISLSGGTVDDGYFSLTLPFNTYFNGTSYGAIHIGTNSYATFGAASTAYSGLGASTPAYDKIMVDAGDRGSGSLYYYGSAALWELQYEGSANTSGSTTDIAWKMTCMASDPKTIKLEIFKTAGTGTTGMFSASTLISSLGGAGTAWNIVSV